MIKKGIKVKILVGKDKKKEGEVIEIDRKKQRAKVKGINIVSSVGNRTGKTDSGWKENLSRIAEAHPRSNLAKRYGKKSIKQIKTEQVIKKHSKRIIKNG